MLAADQDPWHKLKICVRPSLTIVGQVERNQSSLELFLKTGQLGGVIGRINIAILDHNCEITTTLREIPVSRLVGELGSME